jgi:hypothetical protein
MMNIRIVLPAHLRTLARVDGSEVTVQVEGPPVTLRAALDALEARFPVLEGTIREHVTKKRRPFIRFFACEEDLSMTPPETIELPAKVLSGDEPLYVIGAIAGGLA